MEQEMVIDVSNVSKTYPGVKALNKMKLQIHKGQIHALVGENGAGKSTLIKILAGAIQPDMDANIRIGSEDFNSLSSMESIQKGISVIFQDFSLFNNLTVAENITFGDYMLNGTQVLNIIEMKKKAKRVLDEMHLDLDLDAVVGTLPVANHQMIAIARAILQNAKLIIMDEPTSTLSGAEVQHLFEIMKNLKEKGISILFVSHKLQELFQIADEFTVMRDGNYIGTYKKKELNENKLISLMVGREVTMVEHIENAIGKPILQVKNMSRKGNYKNISFTLHEGEILGLTGLVGAGRSEVLASIFGLNKPDEGKIFFEGKEVNINSPYIAKHLGISFVPEDRHNLGFVGNKSIIQNVSLPNLISVSNKFGIISQLSEEMMCKKQMEALQVRPFLPNMLAGNLSGGNQQKIVIGKWLASNPKVLMIDEPTNGIDVGAKNEIHAIIQKLAKKGVAIIMVSSDLQEIRTISDRILVMRRGYLVGEFNPATDNETIMQSAFLGKADAYKDEHEIV